MSRSPESSPLPSDRLRVGDCVVEVALREVHAPAGGRPRRITPKSMGVLLVLVENAGKVVARDTLLAQVWPETLPTNDVVTQAITQLRKAFAEERGNPQYIETIAKTGYRLLAPVQWLPTLPGVAALGDPGPSPGASVTDATVSAAASPTVDDSTPRNQPALADGLRANQMRTDPPRPRSTVAESTELERLARDPLRRAEPGRDPRRRPHWRAIAGATALGALLLTLALLWIRSSDRPRPDATTPLAVEEPRLQPDMITSQPGFELAPSLSPDAAMVAYMAVPPGQRNIAIMLQTTAPTAPRQLTRPTGMADDASPQWSPDGREIAFLRVQPDRGCQVLLIPANGGAERSAGSCDQHNLPSFDWTPDGRGLIFSGGVRAGHEGLHVFDLASGASRRLDYAARAGDVDFAPRYSPDGRWIVFVRNSPLGDFWRLPATGGTAERLTYMNAEIRGWDWSPNGNALIYARRNDSQSRLYRFDLGSGATTDLGIEDGEEPVVAANAPALAYVRRRSYFGIYRFALDGNDGPRGAGERLFASSGRDRLPAIAPDGQQLVFTSDRSGEFGLWWADPDRPASLRLLTGVRPESRHVPSWSADSRRVLVAGTGPTGQTGIFEVLPASGQVARLPIPLRDPVHAAYLPADDPARGERLLVVADGGGGRLELTLFDRSAQPWRELATIDDVSLAQADPVGQRVLFTRPGAPGLWQADLQLSPSSVRRIDAKWPVTSRYRAWVVAGDGGIYSTSRLANCPALLSHRDDDGHLAQPRCLDRSRRAATTGFSVNARTGEAFVTLAEWDGGDIGFIALDPPAEALWPGTTK